MTSWRQQINQHIVEPSAIRGFPNGQLPDAVLVDVHNGRGVRVGRLCAVAARSWEAMVAAAKADGVLLDATDTYRPLAAQKSIFADRYRTTNQGNGHRECGGKTWYLRKGKATAACPGTSNHGRGLAVDNRFHGDGLRWLEANARRFGWAWEVTSEDWHIHYMPGDQTPQAVLDQETHAATSEEDDDMPQLRTLDADVNYQDTKFHKGDVYLFTGNVRHHVTPDELPTLIADFGQPTPISTVGFTRLVDATALDAAGLRSLPPDQRTQLNEIHDAITAKATG